MQKISQNTVVLNNAWGYTDLISKATVDLKEENQCGHHKYYDPQQLKCLVYYHIKSGSLISPHSDNY